MANSNGSDLNKSMSFFKYISLLIILSFSLNSFSNSGKRLNHCYLLPVLSDSNQIALKQALYLKVKNYLVNSHWCNYSDDEKVNELLKKYKVQRLGQHLRSPKVLTLISQSAKVGSLIKIKLKTKQDPKYAEVSIIAANGEDLYLRDRIKIENFDKEHEIKVSNSIINFLKLYGENLPYISIVDRVYDSKISFRVKDPSRYKKGEYIVIKRPMRRLYHPMQKELTVFKTKQIGIANIIEISDNRIIATHNWYDFNEKIQEGDWLSKRQSRDILDRLKRYHFSKKYELDFHYYLGKGRISSKYTSTTSSHAPVIGLALRADAYPWIEYVGAGFELDKKLGFYGIHSRSLNESFFYDHQITYKFKLKLRYYPDNFFYGPQIIIFGGYEYMKYGLPYSESDGLNSTVFHGALVGFEGSYPVKENYRLFSKAEFMPTPKFKETTAMYGNADQMYHYNFEFGAKVLINKKFSGNLSLQYIYNMAYFDNAEKYFGAEEILIKNGFTFYY